MKLKQRADCSQPDVPDPEPCLGAHVLTTPSGQRILFAPIGSTGRSDPGPSESNRVIDVALDKTEVVTRMYVLGVGEWIAAGRTESLADRR